MKKKLAFLLAVGFPKEIATQMVTTEDLGDDFDADANTATVRASLGESFKQDDDFIKPIKAGWLGAALRVKEKELVKLSDGKITEEEVQAMPEANRFNALMKLFKDRVGVVPKKDGEVDDKDKEIEKLNKEIELRDRTIGDYKDNLLPAAEKKAVEVEKGFHIRGALQKAATAGDRKLLLAPEKTTSLLLDDVTQDYDLDWDGKRVVLKEKGKDVIAHNPKERSKQLTLEDVVPGIGEKNGYFVLNNGNDQKKEGTGNDTSKGADKPKYELPGLAKAQAHETANPVSTG